MEAQKRTTWAGPCFGFGVVGLGSRVHESVGSFGLKAHLQLGFLFPDLPGAAENSNTLRSCMTTTGAYGIQQSDVTVRPSTNIQRRSYGPPVWANNAESL